MILPILKLKTQKVSRNFLGKEKPTLKQIRQQKLSYLQSSSRFDVVGNKGLARSGSDGAASNVCERHKIRPQLLYCRDGRATRRSSDFLSKEKSEQARKGRRDLILPILKLKTQKVSRNFLGKEKPTLKQIRQQKLSYLQSSSRFDVVGNKGLARSGSDGAASNVCERHKIRPQLLYCRDGRATRRSSDFLSKEKSEQAKRRRPDNGGQ